MANIMTTADPTYVLMNGLWHFFHQHIQYNEREGEPIPNLGRAEALEVVHRAIRELVSSS